MAGSLLGRLGALHGDEVALSIFADELAEKGDLRGEYLALTRAVQRLPHWQRGWADAAWERRRIEAPVQRAWRDSAALDELPGALQVSLSSGLPTRLCGPASALTQARPFPLSQAIRTLELTTVSPDLAALLRLPWLGQVRELFLSSGPRYGDSVENQHEELQALLTSEATAGLERLRCQLPQSFSARILPEARFLSRLEHLSLSPSEAARLIDPTALLVSGPLPLEELLLLNATLPHAAVTGLARNCARLTWLGLTATSLSAAGLGPLADALPDLRRLELLDVDTDWDRLAELFETGFAPALESLELAHARHTRKGPRSPGFARFLTALARRPIANLRLGRADLTPGDLQSFLDSGLLGRLDALNLDGNPIGEPGVEQLAGAAAPKLRSLSLAQCGFGDRGGTALGRAKWLPQLHVLALHQNGLDPAVLRAVLGDRVLPQLRALRLPMEQRIALSSRALPRLVSAEPPPPAEWHFGALLAGTAPPLEALQLEAATDEALFALAGAPQARALRKLELKITPFVSDAGIFALVESEHLGGVLDLNVRYPQVSQKSHRAINERFGFSQFAVSHPRRE